MEISGITIDGSTLDFLIQNFLLAMYPDAIVGKSGNDREYDYETNTETKNYTYSGKGGVPIGNWLDLSPVSNMTTTFSYTVRSVFEPAVPVGTSPGREPPK